jgi:hypothetical protein
VAEQVVQVAGDPEALVLRGQARQLGARLGVSLGIPQRPLEGECQQRGDRDRGGGDVVPCRGQADVPGRDRDRYQQGGQRQRDDDGGRADA